MNPDLVGAGLCGIMALSAFVILVFSDPAENHFMPLPEYVRAGFGVAGLALMWRSVDFVTIATSPDYVAGHINGQGLVAAAALAYAMVALSVYLVHSKLPSHAWDRLKWLESFARHNQGAVPTKAQIAAAVRARGVLAVAPLEGPDAVVRELETH